MNFFYGNEPDMFTFFKIPKLLFSEPYRDISTDAKLLFGLMLDRMALSSKSQNWIDPDGRVYIYFTVDEVIEMLNVGKNKALSLYKELETCELIQRERQPFGKPAKIYVRKFFAAARNQRGGGENQTSRSLENKPLGFKNQASRSLENKPLPYETDFRKTDINETYCAEPPKASPAPPVPPVSSEKPKRERKPTQSFELTSDEESALLAFSPGLCAEVRDWFRYKAERRQMYGETFRRKFISTVVENARKHGADAVAAVIRESASNGYQGVTWDKLTRNSAYQGGYSPNGYGGGRGQEVPYYARVTRENPDGTWSYDPGDTSGSL